MSKLLKISIALFVAVNLGACAPGDKSKAKNDADGNQRNIVVDDKMDSEQLAEAGEQLFNPATFMLADKTLDMALAKDPDNKKAQFYKTFLKRVMVLKGAGARIRPWIRAYADMGTYETESAKMPKSPLRDFIYTGKEDVSSTTQVQDILIQYRDALIEYYGWLRKNQDLSLTLNLNPYVFSSQLSQDAVNSCEVVGDPSNELNVKCDFSEVAQRKVNPADMIALRQYVAGEIVYFTIYTSYTAEGAEQFIKKNRKGNMTQSQIYALLENSPSFGKIRKDHTLGILSSLGGDVLSAWKWAMQNQNALCPSVAYEKDVYFNAPNGFYEKNAKRRKGQLFDEGLCVKVDSEAQKNAALLERALQGAVTVDVAPPHQDQKKNVIIDAFALSRKPIVDLKTIFPSSYNECGKPRSLKDNTLGGIYPQGNADQFLDTGCNQ